MRVERRGDRLRVRFDRGFKDADVDVVKAIPGRRWDPRDGVWWLPDAEAAMLHLRAAFGDRLAQARPVATSPEGGSSQAGPPHARPQIDALLDRVRRDLHVRGYSPRTRRVYLGQVRRFLEWCGGSPMAAPEGPSEAASRYLMSLLEERDISRSYHNQVVSAIRFLFEIVLEEPGVAVRVPRPRAERRLPTVLSPEEVRRLLEKPRNPKHRALLMLAYSSGLRVSEVVCLRVDDIDEERGLVRVRAGKGRKDRYTLLSVRAAEALRTYQAAFPSDRWLFPGQPADRHIHPRSVQRVVRDAARAAGIRKRVTMHTLRHSFATHLMEGGTHLRYVQELLGHRSPRTTQIYTHVARTKLERIRSPLDEIM